MPPSGRPRPLTASKWAFAALLNWHLSDPTYGARTANSRVGVRSRKFKPWLVPLHAAQGG